MLLNFFISVVVSTVLFYEMDQFDQEARAQSVNIPNPPSPFGIELLFGFKYRFFRSIV